MTWNWVGPVMTETTWIWMGPVLSEDQQSPPCPAHHTMIPHPVLNQSSSSFHFIFHLDRLHVGHRPWDESGL